MAITRDLERIIRRGVIRGMKGAASAKAEIDPSGEVSSILLVRVDRLGDLLISIPTIRLLRARYPEARIDLVLGEKNRSLAELVPEVDTVLVWERNPVALLGTIGRLRRREWDQVVNLHLTSSGNAELVSGLAGGATLGGNDLVGSRVGEHVAIKTSRVVARLGIETISADHEADHPIALLDRRNPAEHRESGPVISLNLSAGGGAREWPADKMKKLAKDLMQVGTVRLLVKPGEEARAAEFPIGDRCRLVEPTSDIWSLLKNLGRSSMVVTPDCGTVHLAAAVGTPVVGLYGEQVTAREWRAWGVASRTVASESGALAAIPVSMVRDAVYDLLGSLTGGSQP